MSLYGDRSNIIVLCKRSEQYKIQTDVHYIEAGQKIPANTNILVIGGGQDSDQLQIVNDFRSRHNELLELIHNGMYIFAICGGYQLLGEFYGDTAGVNILPIFTKKNTIISSRIIGNFVGELNVQLPNINIIPNNYRKIWGFENHGGETYFKNTDIKPLLYPVQGYGNNKESVSEGCIYPAGKGMIVGSYLHTFLAKNIYFADWLISQSLGCELPVISIDNNTEELNYKHGLKLKY